jgi:acetolactate synthase-1/2/3 large subunit
MSEVAATALDGITAPVNPPRPEDVLRAVQTVFGPDSIVVTDVGQHQMWAAHFCMRKEPRTFLCSGGLGTMGFGLPAGIGAQLSNPGKPVIVVAGDGGFQMTLAELGTVAAERLPLKILVINNGYLGMVRQWQELFYDRRYSAVDTRPGQPDFAALARAYGIEAITVTQVGQVPEAIMQAQQHQGPFLIDFRVLEEENVYPMVAPGEGNDNMILG